MIPSIAEEIRDLQGLFGSSRDPEGRAFVPLADAYRRSGDPAQSLEVLESGLSRHPELASAHLVRGLALRDLAEGDRAVDAFGRVLELDADNARALVGLGRLMVARGERESGEELIGRGLALDASLLEREVSPLALLAPDPEEVTGEVGAAPDPEEVTGEVGAAADPEEVTGEVGAAADPATRAGAPPAADDGDGLEAMEWEVIDIDALRPSPDDLDTASDAEAVGVIDIADLAPDPAPDPVETGEPSPFDLTAAALPGDEADEGLDIDWGFAVDEGTPDDDVVDAASLAPDGWPTASPSVAEEPPITPPGSGILRGFSDLAVDLPPETPWTDDDDDGGEALPTRTLGELYAAQGLHSEAVKVFESMVARHPDDDDLRQRLEELRRSRADGAAAPPRAAADQAAASADRVTEGPPVSDYFQRLLGWAPDPEDPGAPGTAD